MKDELLSYYQHELEQLQNVGKNFAKHYPKIAGNLASDHHGPTDPSIARLIEAVAFMNARVHHKLDNDFSEFTDGLFNILQPAYQHPLPGMLIAQFNPQPDLAQPFIIPRHTQIERITAEYEPQRFNTCYATTLLPIAIHSAELLPHCETAPALLGQSASGCLHLVLRCLDPDQTFSQFPPQALRFFLPGSQAWAIYDVLLRQTCAISLANAPDDKQAVWLTPERLNPIGFSAKETILPYAARQPLAYQLLTEYFAYPEKFLFLELAQPDAGSWLHIGNELHLYFYLKQVPLTLQTVIRANSFALGCTPLINLYSKMAEPVVVSGYQSEYAVIPDIRETNYHAIYSIDQVSAVNSEGDEQVYLPLYSLDHTASGYWVAQRRTMAVHQKIDQQLSLRLTAQNGEPLTQIGQVLRIQTHCFNPLLSQLWQQLEEPVVLQLSDSSAPVTHITALTEPGIVRYPQLLAGNNWRLVSSLAQQHLSLLQQSEAAIALREMMQLYDIQANQQSQTIIQSIQKLQIQSITQRLPQAGIISFCQGLAITLELEEEKLIGSSLIVFIKILEQFLTLQASLNSFIQLKVVNKNQQLVYEGPAMIGGKKLL